MAFVQDPFVDIVLDGKKILQAFGGKIGRDGEAKVEDGDLIKLVRSVIGGLVTQNNASLLTIQRRTGMMIKIVHWRVQED